MSIHNYEIVRELDKENNNDTRSFKVKEKSTGHYYLCYVIDFQYLNKQQCAIMEETIKVRSTLVHPHLLNFHELIRDVKSSLLYVLVQYCRHGSLRNLVDVALRENSRICEEFLCRVIYQIALFIKTNHTLINLNIENIFFDEEYNVKLFNFNVTTKSKITKSSVLGIMLFEICSLSKFRKNNFETELKNCINIYSKDFLAFVTNLIKDSCDLKKIIDKILCNSTLLSKATHWHKNKLLIKIGDKNHHLQIAERNEGSHSMHIERLWEKDLLLKRKEKELQEREYKLVSKEKEIYLLEKKLKEGLKCNCNKDINDKPDLDSTYVSIGDSVIVCTTSTNTNNIKPVTFTKTVTEKRIKFKGHSPLKDIHFNRRSAKFTKTCKAASNKSMMNSEWVSCSTDTDKSSLTSQKQLFRSYEKHSKDIPYSGGPKPMQWTEENKRNAFELLRRLNSNQENIPPEVKHTNL
ncbi:uncharacterized protein LOC114337463 [Diabrotica virgifera virgifera]|uniref:G2-specific protein kinase fin1-like n=1 Tax=Diabrotica virgifera virgifera TaxID=50390 RepID=A0A6P7G442_DIAVI|nr:uncharacterized protein LOC114337463 [Diabrotica virgifera virgifera]XP_050509588.1 uncharacterized protein LOC114337463 [Diabrotica virgifera virgifera]